VGDRIDEEALRGFLVRMGFSQAPTVTEPGDYAMRGGIIDIYPPGEAARCGSISSATCWTARAGSIRPRSAPPKS
jgi:transcription-repair coupling factor (superfamily II helicase)